MFLLPAHFFYLTFKLTHFELIKFILNRTLYGRRANNHHIFCLFPTQNTHSNQRQKYRLNECGNHYQYN